MTLKEFDTLKRRDFDNGAVLNEIRETIKAYEELEFDNRKRIPCPVCGKPWDIRLNEVK